MQAPRGGPFGELRLLRDGPAEPVWPEPVQPVAAEPTAEIAETAKVTAELPSTTTSADTAADASSSFAISAAVAVQYMVAEDTRHILVRVYDRHTGETLRLIPPTLMVSTILKSLGVKSVSRLDRLV